ncbi:glycosyltransferase family 2 protein [Clostridium beijerinckii]|uniref:Rhamnosyltransferase n=1 Tax=Clostridium beijerinckii TaxID=1520 RepID=A0AAE5H8T9_CLOBE|nr:glycosyltransferase family 2 protein [Clostridium beijerinckii]NSB16587.1 rhamnosyltransferase [Clostridium beijerinckii]OOM26686.1 N-glycosyltransferase [Clostridium beijerinckii]
MNNKVCALIITYNIDEKIIEVANSIVNQVELLVIVDNSSRPQTIKLLERLNKNPNIKVIFNDKNCGIAKALNQGINFVKENNYEWILTLDHDSVCEKDMIKNMLSCLNDYNDKDNIGILTPKIFEMHKQNFISKNSHQECKCIKVKDCIQSGSLIKLKVFDKIGYFNEELFIYHVDFDFCQRLLKSNYDIVQCNNVTLYHEEGYKVVKRFLWKKVFYNNYSSSAIYYITRNTIYMCKTYSVIYIKRIIKDFIFITLFDKKRKERLFYLLKGIHDGILNKYGKLEIIPK